jgi:4-hydroxybenzoate polyprenyltransferase
LPGGPLPALIGSLVRLSHPFPSLVNALATAGIAILAGGEPAVAARLGGSMLALQASIGAWNDVVDAPRDRVGKPSKPIASGALPARAAMGWGVLTLVAGLALALPSGASTLLVGAVGVGLGYAYDARLSRTAVSWVPLALALPLVPVFGWLGATGGLPSGLGGLVAAAVFAGSGLMIGNALVDLERDRAAAKPTIAVALGARRGWWVHVGAIGVAALLAWALAPGGEGPSVPAALRAIGVPAGTGALVIGGAAIANESPRIRERGWELEAIGMAVLGLGWLAGTASAGRG